MPQQTLRDGQMLPGEEGLGSQGVSKALMSWSTYICNKCFEDNSARDKRVYLKPIKLIRKRFSLLREERITQGMKWKNLICGVGDLSMFFLFKCVELKTDMYHQRARS